MPPTVATAGVPNHLQRLENLRATEAKHPLKNVEVWKQQVGQAIDYAISLSNRTQKEVWAALGHKDGAQLNRWIAATENAQLGPLFAIEWLRQPLVISLAGLAGGGVTVETVIRVQRGA